MTWRSGDCTYLKVYDGVQSVYIPVARFKANTSGPHAVVIGGMDGDEYAGIEAAYQLIRDLKVDPPLKGSVTVIPIINVPGFFGKVSMNPRDGKYPKCCFPGSGTGTSTDRILDAVVRAIDSPDIWIELHGGSLVEDIEPIVWMGKTGISAIDEKTQSLVHSVPAPFVIYETFGRFSPQVRMAQMGCMYVLTEAGHGCDVTDEYVRYHRRWIDHVFCSVGIRDTMEDHRNVVSKTVIHSLSYIYAPWDGIFKRLVPDRCSGCSVKKGDALGTMQRLDSVNDVSYAAPETGILLYSVRRSSVRKGEVIGAIGHV